MRPRLMTEYSVRKILVKPRLGRRRCSGIWPPSKPRIMREPDRERWPLWPRLEVLPMPEPIPRPTRFLPVFACLGARRLERFFAILSSLNAGWLNQADSHFRPSSDAAGDLNFPPQQRSCRGPRYLGATGRSAPD